MRLTKVPKFSQLNFYMCHSYDLNSGSLTPFTLHLATVLDFLSGMWSSIEEGQCHYDFLIHP